MAISMIVFFMHGPRMATSALLQRVPTMLRLTPPTVTYISVTLAAIAAAVHYAHVPIPYTHSGFTLLFVGYVVLLAGNLLEGV